MLDHNKWYAKDCSRKVRSAFRTKAKNGEYTDTTGISNEY